MPMDPSILTGLQCYWPIDEGAGAVAADRMGRLDLTLTGTARGASGLDGLWGSAHGGHFGGRLAALMPELWAMLEAPGSAATVAVEHWFGGYAATVDPFPFDVTSGSQAVVEIIDGPASELYLGYALQAPPPQDPSTNTHVYFGAGLGVGNGVDTFIEAPPVDSGPFDPYLLVVEMVRIDATDVRCRLYVGGSYAGAQVLTDGVYAWPTSASYALRFGGPGDPASTVRAALWLRALTSGERGDLFTEGLSGLEDLLDGGGGVDLVDGAGNGILTLAWPMPREGDAGASIIESDGPRREVRRVHERRLRRYTLSMPLADKAEVEKVRTVLLAAAGGGLIRWRHPYDDAPGTPETAPLWRLGADAIEVGRTVGGGRGVLEFTLEEV